MAIHAPKKVTKSMIFSSIIVAGLFIYTYFKKDFRIALKAEETVVVVARVTRDYVPPKSGSHYIDYEYNYDGKKMYGGRNTTDVISSPQYLVDKFFPLIVSKADPERCTVLITPKDFEFFDKKFPDSLNWIVGFVREDEQ